MRRDDLPTPASKHPAVAALERAASAAPADDQPSSDRRRRPAVQAHLLIARGLHCGGPGGDVRFLVSVAATGASTVLWGAALWQRDAVAPPPAAAGVIVGAVLALGIVSGSLHLNVRGIVLVAMLQGVWILLVVAYLLRAQSSSSQEQADGRSI